MICSRLPIIVINICIHLIQKRLSSELLHCALHIVVYPYMDVTNLYIVACQECKNVKHSVPHCFHG